MFNLLARQTDLSAATQTENAIIRATHQCTFPLVITPSPWLTCNNVYRATHTLQNVLFIYPPNVGFERFSRQNTLFIKFALRNEEQSLQKRHVIYKYKTLILGVFRAKQNNNNILL